MISLPNILTGFNFFNYSPEMKKQIKYSILHVGIPTATIVFVIHLVREWLKGVNPVELPVAFYVENLVMFVFISIAMGILFPLLFAKVIKRFK